MKYWKHILIFSASLAEIAFAGRRLKVNFNGDGNSNGSQAEDIALVGPKTWNTIPVIYTRTFSDGTRYTYVNSPAGSFSAWAGDTGAVVIPGDFNGDGLTDIALTGGNWSTIPVAFPPSFTGSDTAFSITNNSAGSFPRWSVTAKFKIPGDFNNDGKTDIALVGGGWSTLPVAFSTGQGTFNVTNLSNTFAALSNQPNVRALGGDFDGDGKTDIALVGGGGWSTIPVAYSNGDGTFSYYNISASNFASWSQGAVHARAGDFNGDGKTDIVLLSNWSTIPVATFAARGSVVITNNAATSFGGWSVAAQQVIIEDFDQDGKEDIVLTGGSGWNTVPFAISAGSGNFNIYNPRPQSNSFFVSTIPVYITRCCYSSLSRVSYGPELWELKYRWEANPGELYIPFGYINSQFPSYFRDESVGAFNNFVTASRIDGVKVVNAYKYAY